MLGLAWLLKRKEKKRPFAEYLAHHCISSHLSHHAALVCPHCIAAAAFFTADVSLLLHRVRGNWAWRLELQKSPRPPQEPSFVLREAI
jgi:hypothetical protein